ncbi:MAG: gliding motility-associated C-terminal domain-containing protein [Flavobacteriales bacterium]|nr:gliding motility-associated C-terminal domain-containing protein [Flavobacteriales bacterium]
MLRRVHSATLLSLMLASVHPAPAQAPGPLPTMGTDFWVGFMQNAYGAQELRLYIASPTATSGTVSIPLAGWSQSFAVPANGVALVVVPNTAEHIGSETVTNKGVRVQTQAPVTVSAVSFQSYTHDGTQVLPVDGLGTEYRAEAYRGIPGFNEFYKSELLIVATQDGTQVEITPTVNTLGGHAAGVPFTVQLDQGEAYQVQSALAALNLTGTLVRGTTQNGSCRPFAVFGGSMCANVPVACAACDHLYEQLVPVEHWGTSFHSFKNGGPTTETYRIQCAQNGTSVTVNGGPPVVLNPGQIHEVNGSTAPVCISASAPISVAQISEGYSCAGAGDPSMILLEPDDRTTLEARFSTVASPQITGHRLNLVVPTVATAAVQLDGTAIPASQFTPYASCPTWSYASLTITPGTHRVLSSQGIHVYAYGSGTGESYGFTANAVYIPPAVTDTLVCVSGPVTLSAPHPLDNAIWEAASNPGTTLATGWTWTFTPTQNDTYTVNGELPGSACPEQYSFHVGIQVPLTLQATANGAANADVCQFGAVQLGALPVPDPQVFDLAWTPTALVSDPTIHDPVAFPMNNTWFRLQVSNPLGCGSIADSVFVAVTPNDIHSVRVSASDSAICSGESSQLMGDVYRTIAFDPLDLAPATFWSAINGGTVANTCGSATGNALLFTGSGTREARTNALDVVNGGALDFQVYIATGTAPCENADPGDDVVLEYSINGGGSWTPFDTMLESQFSTFTSRRVEVPMLARTNATLFRWWQLAHSGAGQDVWAIDNVIITHIDNAPGGMQWSPSVTLNNPNSATPIATPTGSTWYTFSATGGNGCVFTDSLYIEVRSPFSITLPSDTTLCSTVGIPLHATASSGQGIVWQWSPNNGSLSTTTGPTPTATPNATTTYTLTATTNIGCTDTEQITLTVGPMMSVSASASDVQLCQGESSQLTATVQGPTNAQLQWQPAGSLNNALSLTPIASPTGTTTYIATLTDPITSCAVQASVTVAVTTAYTIAATPDTTLCNTLGFQLNVQHNVPAPFSIAWTPSNLLNSGGIASPSIMADTTMAFNVAVTDGNGCSVSDSVHVIDAFDSMINPVNMSACQGQSLLLDAGFPGSDYVWAHGPTTQTVLVNSSASYSVEITDVQGCQTTKVFNVTFHQLPPVDLGADTTACGAASLLLDAHSPGNTIVWSTGTSGQTLLVNASATYYATATSPQSCVNSDTITVTFAAFPTDMLQDVISCTTALPTLDAGNPGCTCLWSTNADTQQILATISGTFTVMVTTPQLCSAQFDALVTLAAPPIVDLGPDTSVCTGDPLVLDAANPGATFSWNTGVVTQTLAPQTSGIYWVDVSNVACTTRDSVNAVFLPAPSDMLQDVTTCIGEPVLLDAGNPGSTYVWNTNAVTQTLSPTSGGTYTVTVENADGCVRTFDADVTFVAYPVVDLGPDTTLCEGDVLTLDVTNPGATYQWSNGSAGSTLLVSSTGTYSVNVDNGYCAASDVVRATFNPSPSRLAAHQLFACLDEEPHYVVINAGNEGSSFQWNTGESAQVILAGAYGWYFVEVTNPHDCSMRDSIVVNEFCPASIYIPNTFTPNGDGINDTWGAVGKNIASIELMVFDRWGGVLFQTTDPNTFWDGSVSNEEAANHMYAWRLSYRFFEDENGKVGRQHERLGHVTILR